MTTNKGLVRQLAEEMAKSEGIKQERYSVPHWEVIINRFEIYAQVAVKFGAKMFEEGFNLGSEYRENNPLALLQDQCEFEMRERELIAEKEGEDG